MTDEAIKRAHWGDEEFCALALLLLARAGQLLPDASTPVLLLLLPMLMCAPR